MDVLANLIRLVTFVFALIYGVEFLKEFFNAGDISMEAGIASLLFMSLYHATEDIVRVLKALAK